MAGANIGTIPHGRIVQIDSGITGTGTTASNPFSFEVTPGNTDFTGVFQATGTVTTLSADLEASLNGSTWSKYSTALVTAAAPMKTIVLVAGVLYRFNYTTASGSITISVCTN